MLRSVGSDRKPWAVPRQAGAGPFAPRGFGLGRSPQCAGFPRARRGCNAAWRKPVWHFRPVRPRFEFGRCGPLGFFGPSRVRRRLRPRCPTRRSSGRGLCIGSPWLGCPARAA
jgi:hypothetical protein